MDSPTDARQSSPETELSSPSRKRGRPLHGVGNAQSTTPSKRQRLLPVPAQSAEGPGHEDSSPENSGDDAVMATGPHSDASPLGTTPRRRGRPAKRLSNGTSPLSATSSTPASVAPARALHSLPQTPTARRLQAADRSAQRKAMRAFIRKVAGEEASDVDQEDDGLPVSHILGHDSPSAEQADSDDEEADEATTPNLPAIDAASSPTPASVRPRRPRRRKASSPSSPPRDLPPHELYFIHNKPGRPLTSDRTMASVKLLTHDEYLAAMARHQDRHRAEISFLETLHADCFPQWAFELDQGFGLCLYGFGSKRALVARFADYLLAADRSRQMVVVNGHVPTASLREILLCIGRAVGQSSNPTTTSAAAATLTPPTTTHDIASLLAATPDLLLTLVIHSLDAPPLRKPGIQAALAQLASHPQLQLVGSVDTPDFPLLWDTALRCSFNFLFHDCTTFAPLATEVEVVDEVHELLGRKSRRLHGRQGVAFVLRSLPDNARNLYRLLVAEALVALDDFDPGPAVSADDAIGVEYRILYNKAVEEFICSSEMAFRTLLKEYVFSAPL